MHQGIAGRRDSKSLQRIHIGGVAELVDRHNGLRPPGNDRLLHAHGVDHHGFGIDIDQRHTETSIEAVLPPLTLGLA